MKVWCPDREATKDFQKGLGDSGEQGIGPQGGWSEALQFSQGDRGLMLARYCAVPLSDRFSKKIKNVIKC